jgi:hypothetical protein
MQTWARRGIRTALLTGGLLMLGTGIASADEDVNPDRPASPLDGSFTVPINIDNNVLGTPLGTVAAPSATHEVSADLSDFGDTTADDAVRGNRVAGDVVMPVDVSGNAIAAGGDAVAENDSSQSVHQDRPVATQGHDLLAGNVLDIDYALPVQITNNAISGIGNASATGTSTQEASATGDIGSDGAGGTFAGNVVAGQAATPVQATGNAVSGVGTAQATSEASTEGTAGGTIWTDGQDGFGTGNVAGVPLAFPVEVNGNAVGVVAGTVTESTHTDSTHTAAATAGREEPGRFGRPTYVQTNGDPAALAGNVVEPAASGPASVECNAGAALAVADASCSSQSPTEAGGTVQTSGSESVGAGNVVAPSVALPTEGFANAATAGGDATAQESNTVDSTAGGSVYTYGHDSTASGTVIAPSAAGPADVFTNAGAGLGDASATADNTSTSTASGNSVTTATTPTTEAIGNTVAAVGNASATASETKVSSAGGDNNTNDDAGFLAANAAQGAVSGPAQVIGNGGGVLGNTTSTVDTGSDITAGGDNIARGTGGTLAGNIGQAAASLPAQVHGNNATAGGIGTADSTTDTESEAGGDAQTDGVGGFGTGNVMSVPAGSATQAFGDSVAALGSSSATADSATETEAGGDTTTNGMGGTVAGNVIGPHAIPIAQGFGAAVAGAGGLNRADGTSWTHAESGGDIETNGDSGTISGNLLDVPAAAVAQPTGDAVSVVGSDATAISANDTTGVAGGSSTTSGAGGFLSGLGATVPAGANAPIYGVPVEVLANALAEATHRSDLRLGEAEPAVNLVGGPIDGLGITDMPRLPELPLPGQGGVARAEQPVPGLGPVSNLVGAPLGGFEGGLPAGQTGGGQAPGRNLPGRLSGVLGGVAAMPTVNGPATLPAVTRLPRLPHTPAGPNVPAMPALDGLPVHNARPFGADPGPALNPVLNPAQSASLADTRSKLAGLFAHNPIG